MTDHKKFADKRSALYKVDPRKLKVKPGLNARGDLSTPDNKAHIKSLASQIEQNGFLDSHPLEVAEIDGEIYVTAGHCRLAAVMLLIAGGHPIEYVPYVPEQQGTSDVDRIINQRISNSGKPLTPLEDAFNVKRLVGLGLDAAAIAKRYGCSDTHIHNLLDLNAAPSEVKDMVKAGEVSASAATDAVQRHGATKGTTILKEAVATAKATGKTKATPKHIAARADARDAADLVEVMWKPKEQMLGVKIGQTRYVFSAEDWLKIGQRIVDEAKTFVNRGRQDDAPAFVAAPL